ncbi:MAG: EAL domain-containing protein [Desulfatiglandaceae bacterium]|jgi:diguanylate cyclase (GGDEF)-like protein/PAS domain S-box-containing protein
MRKFNFIKAALIIAIIGVMALSSYTLLVISPKYTNLLVENTEEEAIRAGAHLSFMLFGKDEGAITQDSLSNVSVPMIMEDIHHLVIQKLKIFSSSGEILFSTDKEEIGQINRKDYFVQVVAKGKPYTKTVNKNSESAEGIISKTDVVESYVPIMRQDKFAGAFEIYYDISKRKSKLDGLVTRMYWTIFPSSLALLGIIVFLSLKASRDYEKLREAESKLQKAYSDVEQQVLDRTDELRRANVQLKKEIEDRKEYEKQMILAASVFENTIEGIVITDSEGIIQRVNKAFTTITGFNPEEVIGKNPRILKSDRHAPAFYEEMWASLITRGMWEGEIWNRRKSGETYPERLLINVITGSEGKTIHYVALFHDITDIKHSEEQLLYQANYDALTGLPNHQLFNDRLKMALTHAHRNELPLGVLFIDLDDFKNVNDSQGHYFGDLLLKQVAERLTTCCREEDTVARLGGDEFLLLAQFIRKEEPAATRLAERIAESFKKPFTLEDKQIYVNASIGITIYPNDGNDIETLVKNADVAMYRAKCQGKNQFRLFTDVMHREVMRRIALGNDLRGGLEREEFMVYYQPKVTIQTGVVSGMEALVRWNRLKKEMVPPGEFISLAEDNGVIFPLGEWVLSTACRQAGEFGVACHRDPCVAVNLSVKQFCQENLVAMIRETLNKTGLSPNLLTIEITENIVISDIEATIKTLKLLKELGIHVSIDDFGTGYSSLSYLKKMPLSELKIDKSFVDDTPDDADACAIVKTILSLAKSLNLKTVAEGVETKRQLAFLRSEGCDEMQGYLFSKPLPATEMATLLIEGKKIQIG